VYLTSEEILFIALSGMARVVKKKLILRHRMENCEEIPQKIEVGSADQILLEVGE
jgi:hypothetical protein